jgi:hypothetical protein
MLLADIKLVTDAMTVLNAPPDLIDQVKRLLLDNSSTLREQVVTRPAEGWFGGSGTGQRLAVNATMAHQEVEQEFQKLADGLSDYRDQVHQWATLLDQADAGSQASVQTAEALVAEVATTQQRLSDRTMGDGRFDPNAEGDA